MRLFLIENCIVICKQNIYFEAKPLIPTLPLSMGLFQNTDADLFPDLPSTSPEYSVFLFLMITRAHWIFFFIDPLEGRKPNG